MTSKICHYHPLIRTIDSFPLGIETGHCILDRQIRVRNRNHFFYFSIKTYVMGTQKNRLNETVLLTTQNIFLK